nr:hypothetical protein [Fodinicola feengrottensis]
MPGYVTSTVDTLPSLEISFRKAHGFPSRTTQLGAAVRLPNRQRAQRRVLVPAHRPRVRGHLVVQCGRSAAGGDEVGVERGHHVLPGRPVRGPQRLQRRAEIAHRRLAYVPDGHHERVGGGAYPAEVEVEPEHRPVVANRARLVRVGSAGQLPGLHRGRPHHLVLTNLPGQAAALGRTPDDGPPGRHVTVLGQH